MENTFGPDGQQPMNRAQVGILSAKNRAGTVYPQLSTKELYDHGVTQLLISYTSSAAYENVGIVYAAIDQNYFEICQLGYVPPRDPVQRAITINPEQWDRTLNPGGVDVASGKPVHLAFAAWHRVDAESPWIQNDIQVAGGHKVDVIPNPDNTPDMNIFSFEDLTGGETRDDDYDDMKILVKFVY